MTDKGGAPAPEQASSPGRRPWVVPAVHELPRLTELTLQSGGAIKGRCGTGGSGSTCF
jgi:hypothetical protein